MRNARISIVNTRKPLIHEEDSVVMERTRERLEAVVHDRPDLVLLAEIFSTSLAGVDAACVRELAQPVPGPLSDELGAFARKHGTYIAFGMLRLDGDRVFNSLVLLDRKGRHVWTYDKTTPVIMETVDLGITPGGPPTAFQTDFGRIGAAICFDINFLELAEIYSRQGVELLLFSSMFPGGRLLDVWAIRYGFAVAGATYHDDNRIIDCDGSIIARSSAVAPCATGVLNLNRRVLHADGNRPKLDEIRARYSGDVLVEDLRGEGSFILTSLKPGLEIDDIIAEFGLEQREDYFDRSRQVRAAHGGLRMPTWGLD